MFERFFYRHGQRLVQLYAKLMMRMDILQNNLLPKGPKIFAAPHPTTTDPVWLMLLEIKHMSMVADGALFKIPFFGPYLKLCGHIPVDNDHKHNAFFDALDSLEKGRNIGIFPNGQVMHNEQVAKNLRQSAFGAARLALASGAPVIPIGVAVDPNFIRVQEWALNGCPTTSRWYLKGPYAMTVGDPMYFEGDFKDRSVVKVVTDKIITQIDRLNTESELRLFPPPSTILPQVQV
jgi:1-acyl-sn-glycerol-3-phosphate acyltransferase